MYIRTSIALAKFHHRLCTNLLPKNILVSTVCNFTQYLKQCIQRKTYFGLWNLKYSIFLDGFAIFIKITQLVTMMQLTFVKYMDKIFFSFAIHFSRVFHFYLISYKFHFLWPLAVLVLKKGKFYLRCHKIL